ncbi:hypothetical protein BIV57_16775 [Mangrovactinospora gilvigrisea]|uniref:MgtC/SapB/SrpB/YhiD N-terminal domain-containing protein n=1 Tax=Mangrovactinospora gilvigrisea TaxID=1428644 RepID=A0A1J7BCH4_9ACTN|nr:hypothetical protein BIV57_16775 [Mangrovactinospora gilvigrisea]
MFRFFDAGQGARQFTELAVAFVLSTVIGLERERRQKSAGMRTHCLVGVGAALFMLVSEHGFNDMLGVTGVALDPSRVAAQIVSGIGFIGGGLIFVRRDAVRGLTTAATIWLTCGVGMACGGGLVLLAIAATLVYFLVVQGYPWLSQRLAPHGTHTTAYQDMELTIRYRPSSGLLGRILEHCTAVGFRVSDVEVLHRREDAEDVTDEESRAEARYERGREPEREAERKGGGAPAERRGSSAVRLRLTGAADPHQLVAQVAEMDGVFAVRAQAAEEEAE